MAAIIAAVGSVIGYVGAEVAEESLFERILWPQRFYNALDITTALKLAILTPMGGPLHRAALGVLDRFREHGLYRGRAVGTLLGTVFFHDRGLVYIYHTAAEERDRSIKKQARNCLWDEVLRNIQPGVLAATTRQAGTAGFEAQATRRVKRSTHYLFRLRLEVISAKSLPRMAMVVREDHITLRMVLGVLLSELVSAGMAVAVGLTEGYYAFTALLGMPMALKLLTIAVSVQREGFKLEHLPLANIPDSDPNGKQPVSVIKTPAPVTGHLSPQSALPAESQPEIFELLDPSIGIILIETSHPDILRGFTRHYGHPLRATLLDRTREILNIGIVYAFALKFPAELVVLAWAPTTVQWLWLAYQVYAVLAMHLARLIGWTGCGRTEELLARLLQNNGTTYLASGMSACVVRAGLEVEEFVGVTEAEARKREILAGSVQGV
ncbi:hypothetical protein FNYG_12755 [Fusarium nygamai]|uniref:Uncharacterized protein n=1 Tax=Gibberella nygamai TaxID=42673 RepID=A0A2K0VV42_GIBNY|nr:hypothetical protein FNYG_12755 [Fusarium nygamai]